MDRKSAMFGLPDNVEHDVELKATHSDMCRFDTVSEEHDKELFGKVWGNLDELYDKALERGELDRLTVSQNQGEESLAQRFAALRAPQ